MFKFMNSDGFWTIILVSDLIYGTIPSGFYWPLPAPAITRLLRIMPAPAENPHFNVLTVRRWARIASAMAISKVGGTRFTRKIGDISDIRAGGTFLHQKSRLSAQGIAWAKKSVHRPQNFRNASIPKRIFTKYESGSLPEDSLLVKLFDFS